MKTNVASTAQSTTFDEYRWRWPLHENNIPSSWRTSRSRLRLREPAMILHLDDDDEHCVDLDWHNQQLRACFKQSSVCRWIHFTSLGKELTCSTISKILTRRISRHDTGTVPTGAARQPARDDLRAWVSMKTCLSHYVCRLTSFVASFMYQRWEYMDEWRAGYQYVFIVEKTDTLQGRRKYPSAPPQRSSSEGLSLNSAEGMGSRPATRVANEDIIIFTTNITSYNIQ